MRGGLVSELNDKHITFTQAEGKITVSGTDAVEMVKNGHIKENASATARPSPKKNRRRRHLQEGTGINAKGELEFRVTWTNSAPSNARPSLNRSTPKA